MTDHLELVAHRHHCTWCHREERIDLDVSFAVTEPTNLPKGWHLLRFSWNDYPLVFCSLACLTAYVLKSTP